MNYILEAASAIEDEKTKEEEELSSDISIVYCIDVSGSMNQKKKNMSRLQCVQDTISGQLKDTLERFPKRKMALVTFTNFVDIYGDCTMEKTRIEAANLEDFDFIKK